MHIKKRCAHRTTEASLGSGEDCGENTEAGRREKSIVKKNQRKKRKRI